MYEFATYPINRGKRDNRFCGPAVISLVTGMNTSDAARRIREYSGRRQVTGTSDEDLLAVLNDLRIKHHKLECYDHLLPKERPTLAAWLKLSSQMRKGGRVFLLDSAHHWQLVKNARYACGLTGDWVPLTHAKIKRRGRVSTVYELYSEG